jgi:hypothetical protein
MESQLIPVVVNETAAFRATALRQEGYVQAGDPIQCPLCGLRFVLLLDPKDHSDSEGAASTHREKAAVFFREIIMQDHINDHPHWQFRMTVAIR